MSPADLARVLHEEVQRADRGQLVRVPVRELVDAVQVFRAACTQRSRGVPSLRPLQHAELPRHDDFSKNDRVCPRSQFAAKVAALGIDPRVLR